MGQFFAPTGISTWYLYDYDPVDKIFMAYVNLIGAEFAECGPVSLAELEEAKFPPFGLGIERDMHWTPRPLSEVIATVEKGEHL